MPSKQYAERITNNKLDATLLRLELIGEIQSYKITLKVDCNCKVPLNEEVILIESDFLNKPHIDCPECKKNGCSIIIIFEDKLIVDGLNVNRYEIPFLTLREFRGQMSSLDGEHKKYLAIIHHGSVSALYRNPGKNSIPDRGDRISPNWPIIITKPEYQILPDEKIGKIVYMETKLIASIRRPKKPREDVIIQIPETA